MKYLFYITIFFIIISYNSISVGENTDEYVQTDEYFTNLILNDFKYELGISPKKRTLSQGRRNRITKFEAYGYRINLPWDFKFKIIRNEYTSIIFSVNNYLLAFSNPQNNYYSDLVLEIYSNIKKDMRNFLTDYINSKNNFELVTSSLNASKDVFSPNEPLYEKVKLWLLLNIKRWYLFKSEKHNLKPANIYFFETNRIKGYQIGKPQRDELVLLSLFKNDNEELIIEIMKCKKDKINQGDIDFIINNIEKLN